ncbi:MAG: SusD/RagB family nutrient-binding outer membrane lipoprotein [Bacteroidales bacterium]|nr:SusD/RagB family nutrient-binding outer membrane lipoprotein [Bacteroidales bacterium]
MKKIFKYTLGLLAAIMLFTGCEEWLDVNTDPNAMVDSPNITESIYLIGVEAEWAEKAVATFPWYGDDSEWVLWYAWEGSTSATFIITPGHNTTVWNSYSGSLKHAVNLYDKAKENGNNRYQAIAAAIAAWHWFYIADSYDQAPLEQAMKGDEFLHPEPVAQSALYAHGNALLDEAISLFQNPVAGDLVPTSDDDYMMGADFDKWTRLCYSMKARYAMRLAYAPGYSKTGQADAVIAALANGMTSNDDECSWDHLSTLADASWIYGDHLGDYSGQGATPTNWLIDLMNSLDDPRRYEFFTFAEDDPQGFQGHQSGPATTEGHRPSRYKSEFSRQTYPDYIMLYAENLFLKAEAHALRGEWVDAETAMKAGVTADMEFLGVHADSIAAYIAQPALTLPTDEEGAQEVIIIQKYLANIYKTKESYFDYIRTGYPDFDFLYAIQDATTGVTFPRRYMYPLDEIDKNPHISAIGQSDPLLGGTTWDAKPGIGPRAK